MTMMTIRMVTVAACLTLSACAAGPEDAVRGFMEDKAAGRTAEAMQRMDPAMAQTVGPMIAVVLATEAAKGKKAGGLKSVNVVETMQTDADHVTVRAEGHYANGTVARGNQDAPHRRQMVRHDVGRRGRRPCRPCRICTNRHRWIEAMEERRRELMAALRPHGLRYIVG